MSDNLVGGSFIVLQVLAWGYYSAFGQWLYTQLERLTAPVFTLLTHIPLAKQLAVVQEA